MKKVIIFDVDGVITTSGVSKEGIIMWILEKHNLFWLPWVPEIFRKWLNRILLLDKIYEIQSFDKKKVLNDINLELSILESQTPIIPDTLKFIKHSFEKYDFFTNTSLPKQSLKNMFERLDLSGYFMELLAYDDGSKKENIEYVMQVYGVKPDDVLFIDDNSNHIDAVKSTWVHTLLFEQDWISLEEKINKKINT
jgi:HAD superfamily hydrolase (TIGR01509 family)